MLKSILICFRSVSVVFLPGQCDTKKTPPSLVTGGSPSCSDERCASIGVNRLAAGLVLREVELFDQFSLARL